MNQTYLMHHGILGQKWGIRRFQNKDGSLTSAGLKRYHLKNGEGLKDIKNAKGIQNRLNDIDTANARNYRVSKHYVIDGMYDKKAYKTYSPAQAEKNIEEGNKEIKRLLATAKQMHYDVKSESTERLVRTGKESIVAARSSLGLAASIAIVAGSLAKPNAELLAGGSINGYINTRLLKKASPRVKGTKYKVTVNKKSK